MKKLCMIRFLLQATVVMHAQYDDPYQYFPANVGDRWEYLTVPPCLDRKVP
jgi:hypothetical protein